MKTSGSFAVSGEEWERILGLGTGFAGGRERLAALYRQSPDEKTAVAALKKEYGTGGRSYTLLDGSAGFVEHAPAMGIRLRRYQPEGEAVLSWREAERQLRRLFAEGRYLSPGEAQAYEENHFEPDAADGAGGEPAEAPAPVFSIPDAEIERILRHGSPYAGGRLRIAALYSQENTRSERGRVWDQRRAELAVLRWQPG